MDKNLIVALERIRDASPRNTNSADAVSMASWTGAVAATALETHAARQNVSGREREPSCVACSGNGYYWTAAKNVTASPVVEWSPDNSQVKVKCPCGGAVAASAILTSIQPKAAPEVYLRPEVRTFANLMEAQVRENDHKRGWKNDTPKALWDRLREEATELLDALSFRDQLHPYAFSQNIGAEAADVANFAMMIADVCGALSATPSGEEDREDGHAG